MAGRWSLRDCDQAYEQSFKSHAMGWMGSFTIHVYPELWNVNLFGNRIPIDITNSDKVILDEGWA